MSNFFFLSTLLLTSFITTPKVFSQNNVTYEFDNYIYYEFDIVDVIESPNDKNMLLAKVVFLEPVGDFDLFIDFEYFFNTDLGEGNGTPITGYAVDDLYELPGISSDGVGAKCGLNTLYIRTKGSDGVWSYATPKSNLNVPDASSPKVTNFKYPKDLVLGENGEVTLYPEDLSYTVKDNCSENVEKKFEEKKFNCNDIGDQKLSILFEDDNGNIHTENFSITIKDVSAPKLKTKDFTLVLDDQGKGTLKFKEIDSGSFDNCGIESSKLSAKEFDCSKLGDNYITVDIFDKQGNKDSYSGVKVTVVDNSSPKVTTKSITKALGKNGTVTITPEEVIDVVSDNCGIEKMTYELTPSKFTCKNLGKMKSKLIVKDGSGNVTEKDVDVTITADGELPDNIPVKEDAEVFLNSEGKGVLELEQVYDENNSVNCLITKVSLIKDTFYCSDLKNDSVVAKLRIENNSGSKPKDIDVNVIVKDAIKPKVVAKGITVYLDSTGKVKVFPKDINNGSTDNCNIKDYEFEVGGKVTDFIEFNCENVGKSNTVKLRVTDESGNYSSGEKVVIKVLDTITPIVTLKEDIFEIDLENKDYLIITPNDIVQESSDNCSIDLSLSRDTFSCVDSGKSIDIDLFVTNKEDTLLVKKVPVKVIGTGGLPDTVPTKEDIEVFLDKNGEVVITTDQVYDSSNSKSCAKGAMEVVPREFNCDSINKSISVILSLTKGVKTVKGEAKVTISDSIKPTVSAQDLTLDLKGKNELVITTSDIDTGSSDNCGIESKTLSLDRFKRVGDYPVTYTVTDVNGNETSTSVLVKVIDSTITDDVSIKHNSDGRTISIIYDNLPQRLSVYNISGQLMFQTFTVTETMSVAHLGSGLYFFNFVTSSGEKALLKVLIK